MDRPGGRPARPAPAAAELLNTERLLTSMMLVPLAPLGVWLGVRLSQRISPRAFFWLVYSGMLVTGLKLIWDGFRPH